MVNYILCEFLELNVCTRWSTFFFMWCPLSLLLYKPLNMLTLVNCRNKFHIFSSLVQVYSWKFIAGRITNFYPLNNLVIFCLLVPAVHLPPFTTGSFQSRINLFGFRFPFPHHLTHNEKDREQKKGGKDRDDRKEAEIRDEFAWAIVVIIIIYNQCKSVKEGFIEAAVTAASKYRWTDS